MLARGVQLGDVTMTRHMLLLAGAAIVAACSGSADAPIGDPPAPVANGGAADASTSNAGDAGTSSDASLTADVTASPADAGVLSWTAYCHLGAANAAKCASTFSEPKCVSEATCWSKRLRPTLHGTFGDCIAKDPCDLGTCLNVTEAAAGAFAKDPDYVAYKDACMQRRDDCASQGGGWQDDYCLATKLWRPSQLQAFTDCVDGPCSDVTACMSRSVAACSP